MKSFLKVVVAGVVVLVASTAILITSSKSHKDTSTGISAEATPVAATADAGPTYHESNDAIDPYELVKNPYKFKGHSGILDTLDTPVLMDNGARMTSVAYPGGCLQFKKMLDEHTAIFEMMVYQEVLMPAGEIAVILPDSNPPNSLQKWRVLIDGPYEAVNGLGNQITLTAVRFEGYYTPPPKADAMPQPPATATTEGGTTQLPNGDPGDALVKWDSACSARGCLIQTDVLRGISDDSAPPDSKDSREYVSINVAMERATRKPAYITFMVDPRAQPDQGIFVAFTNSRKVDDSWKIEIDQDGANRLPAFECTANACIARIPFGLVPKGKDTRAMNLLDKFTESNSLLVLYMRDGKPYRTMVLLSSFKKEYQRVLSSEFK